MKNRYVLMANERTIDKLIGKNGADYVWRVFRKEAYCGATHKHGDHYQNRLVELRCNVFDFKNNAIAVANRLMGAGCVLNNGAAMPLWIYDKKEKTKEFVG